MYNSPNKESKFKKALNKTINEVKREAPKQIIGILLVAWTIIIFVYGIIYVCNSKSTIELLISFGIVVIMFLLDLFCIVLFFNYYDD